MKDNFGTSRYRLIKIFIKSFIKERFSQSKYDTFLENFSNECLNLYKKAQFTPQLIEFLNKFKNKDLYIASGSDEKEIKYIFHQRGIISFFQDVLGSPTKKTDIVKYICNKYKNNKIILLGDANSDMQAAKENKIDFIFVKDFSVSQDLKDRNDVQVINNLGSLL